MVSISKKIAVAAFLLTLASIHPASVQAQTSVDYVNLYDGKVIKPTWATVSKMLFMGMSDFKSLMQQYAYLPTTDGTGYIASTALGSPYFVINKKSDGVTFLFTKDEGFVGSCKSEVRSMLNGGTVSYEGGFETYRISYEKDGFKYRMLARFKEDENGSMIWIQLL